MTISSRPRRAAAQLDSPTYSLPNPPGDGLWLLSALFRWWWAPPRPPDVPDYLREDVGLPRAAVPRYVLDPMIIHGWRRQ